MRLGDHTTLTFDCYGTLIDWEQGILAALQPLLQRVDPRPSRQDVLALFARHESAQQARTPGMRYPDVLAAVHRELARHYGVSLPEPEAEHRRFGASVPDWPAFPDSAEALRYLKRHYRLVILSNVDRASFAASNRRLDVTFDAIYTAEDIGSYKPDPRNFHHMLDRLAAEGTPADAILHTAQSLFHDHAPAKTLGLATAWIDRQGLAREGLAGEGLAGPEGNWGATMPQPGAGYDVRFTSMAEMAAAHRAEQGGGASTRA
ncbi:MAG: haloacid dehalogenase type II [Janthinobacterium lividum]